ncbi:MAG: hypothetical protein EBU59_13235, partial [Planctomycetia bacterium]|nr:hypothetical protein [Planctomycetia bacterium]
NLTSLGDVSLDGTIQTSGAQNYAANATLIGATTVEAGADVSFGGLVDGAEGLGGLSVNSSGTTTFGGAVGSVVPLTSLTTDASYTVLGGNVTTTGDQTFGGQVNLTTDTTLIAGAGAINASAGVSGAGQNLTVGDANQTGAVTLDGGITLGSLSTGAGDFDVTVSAYSNKTTVTGASEFLNNGTVSLLAGAQFQSFEGGLNASAAQAVRVAGGVATTNTPLSLNNVTAVDTVAKISTTGGQDVGSNGSTLTINGLDLNGATVTTYGGTDGETVLTGAVNLSAGTLSVAAGDLGLGSGGTGATLTATDSETVAVEKNYEISLAAFTTLSAAGQTVNFKADDFLISSAPDSLTAGCLTFSTATAGTNFALGANKGTKGDVVLSQAAFDSFNASRVEIGQSGSSGNIDMGALTLDGPRLDLWANGGGSVAISGAYDG